MHIPMELTGCEVLFNEVALVDLADKRLIRVVV